MPRQKKNRSKVIEIATARAGGMELIAPALDFGDGLSVPGYKAAIADTQGKQATYNALLSQVDEAKMHFEAAQANLGDLSDRMLAAVGGKFGRDSGEYTKAGGRPKTRRTKAKTAPVTAPRRRPRSSKRRREFSRKGTTRVIGTPAARPASFLAGQFKMSARRNERI
jgi:hypothetical protein